MDKYYLLTKCIRGSAKTNVFNAESIGKYDDKLIAIEMAKIYSFFHPEYKVQLWEISQDFSQEKNYESENNR